MESRQNLFRPLTQREAEYGEALARPAVLRANADKDLANPFGVWWNWIHTYFDPADVTAKPVPMVAAVPEARARYVALVWGAKCETAEGVAAEDRAAYDEAIELENQKQQQRLADVCKHYGGSSPDEVPNDAKPAASLYWVVGQKMFTMQCELELEVTRAKFEEQAARESVEMFGLCDDIGILGIAACPHARVVRQSHADATRHVASPHARNVSSRTGDGVTVRGFRERQAVARCRLQHDVGAARRTLLIVFL